MNIKDLLRLTAKYDLPWETEIIVDNGNGNAYETIGLSIETIMTSGEATICLTMNDEEQLDIETHPIYDEESNS